MEEPKAEDFFMRTRTKRFELLKYSKHGLPLALLSTPVFIFIGYIISAFNNAYILLVGSVFIVPNFFESPFISATISLVFLCLGLVLLCAGFGIINRILTERIWSTKQSLLWDRQLGLGVGLLGVLAIIHIPLFSIVAVWLYGNLVEQILWSLLYFAITAPIDGVIGKTLATLRTD